MNNYRISKKLSLNHKNEQGYNFLPGIKAKIQSILTKKRVSETPQGDLNMTITTSIERFIGNELLFAEKQLKLDPDQDLINGGLLDSVAILRLISFIEEYFEVTVKDGEVLPDNFRTINRIKSFVESKQQVVA